MARPLELADFYELTELTDLSLSPDGTRVAFVADEFDPTADDRHSSLFVAPTDGSQNPHRLTRVSDAGMPEWGPHGNRLAFRAARPRDVARSVGRDADTDGDADDADGTDRSQPGDDPDEEPNQQVWVYDLELGGDAMQVTDFDEGARSYDWSPDGDRMVVAARDPTDDQATYLETVRDDGPIEVERLQHKANGVGFLDEVTTYLFIVDVETGEPRRLDEAYGQGAREAHTGLQPAWGSTGRIAFASNRTASPDDNEVVDCYTIHESGDDLVKITDSDLRTAGFTWSSDGGRIAFVGGAPTNWYRPAELYVADDAGEYHSVSASLDRTVPLFGAAQWIDDDSLLCPIADGGLTQLVRCQAGADDPQRVFPAQGRDRTLAPAGFGVEADTVVTALSDPTDGTNLFSIDRHELTDSSVAPTRVTNLNGALLQDVSTPAVRRVTYENGDGVDVEAIVYLPAGFSEDDDPRPMIAAIHGGPMSHDAPEFDFDYAYWTGRGYVVMCPNYRGSTSYGREFAEALKGTRGTLETDDVRSGRQELVALGWVDPDRTFVTGFSYGGITTANVVVRTDEFVAAAAEHGIYDFRSAFGTDDNHNWHDWEFGLPWENPETYDRVSSITAVGDVETPLLVTAGETDWRCPPTQAEQLYVSVKKQGVPAKLVLYQDEHHNIGDPDRAQHRLETLTDWFRRHDPAIETGGAGGSDDGA